MDKLEFSAPLKEKLTQNQKNSEIFPLHMTDISSATTAEVIEHGKKQTCAFYFPMQMCLR